jgi:hypothetical protein
MGHQLSVQEGNPPYSLTTPSTITTSNVIGDDAYYYYESNMIIAIASLISFNK